MILGRCPSALRSLFATHYSLPLANAPLALCNDAGLRLIPGAPPESEGGAGRRGPDGPTGSGASRRRSRTAVRSGPPSGDETASPPFVRRPARGVGGLLRRTPGGRTFQVSVLRSRMHPSPGNLPTAAGLRLCVPGLAPRSHRLPNPTWPEAVGPGLCGLGRRGGVFVWHPSFRIPRPPPPIHTTDDTGHVPRWIETAAG